ncbi:MAG: HRDC domain-containing protein [Bacteroidia bacterium]|nr:HRDC domain-containing protein [Bacteroidia bacterium]
MQFKHFSIPVSNAEPFEEELNRFLRSHKVLGVESSVINDKNGAYWAYCIKYIEKALNTYNGDSMVIKKDYRTILDEDTFQKFSKLREIRKQFATEDAIPAYAVFTDEELAGLAKLETFNVKNMLTIKGIGQKKVEKYGEKFVRLFIENKQD